MSYPDLAGERTNVHATGLVINGLGLMLRGPSGSGKSLLALELLARHGKNAILVADDRLDLLRRADEIVMQAPQNIAGLIELRGRGIIERPFVPEARLDLVVDLVPALERMPESSSFTTRVLGHIVPACPIPARGVVDSAHQLLLVEERLAELALLPPASIQIST